LILIGLEIELQDMITAKKLSGMHQEITCLSLNFFDFVKCNKIHIQ